MILGLVGPDLNAQANWQSATLTTTTGEELTGYIEDRRWRFRIRNLRFRSSEEAPVQKINLQDLTAFRTGSRRYLVQDVTINTSPRDRDKLVSQENAERTKIRAALLVLTAGPVSLYEYTDEESNRHYFIQASGKDLEYLDFGRYAMEQQNNKTFYRESNAFRGTLLRLLDDCFRLRQETIKVKYRRQELVSLIDSYYYCRGDRPDYTLDQENGTWSFGPDLGLIRANPTYGEIENSIYPFTNLTSSEPAIGAHLKYRFGGPRGAVAIRFGALYHNFNVTASVPDLEEEDPSINSTFEYNFNERSLHFQLGPEVVIVRSRYPVFLETMAEYHRVFSYQENRFNRRIVNGQEVLDGLFFNFPNQGALSLSMGLGVVVGDARLSLRGSISRRKYPTYVLNLYRLGVMGSYDF